MLRYRETLIWRNYRLIIEYLLQICVTVYYVLELSFARRAVYYRRKMRLEFTM